jgi:HEPN domain-containing protein
MLTKADLEKLAQIRLEDSLLLFKANRSSSAYYLAGYAVELALKACIAKLIQPNAIPDKSFINAIYTHELKDLVSIAGLRPQLDSDTKADPELATYWAIASNWSEASRYAFWDPMAAATMLHAVHDPAHGVFQWVKRHW